MSPVPTGDIMKVIHLLTALSLTAAMGLPATAFASHEVCYPDTNTCQKTPPHSPPSDVEQFVNEVVDETMDVAQVIVDFIWPIYKSIEEPVLCFFFTAPSEWTSQCT